MQDTTDIFGLFLGMTKLYHNHQELSMSIENFKLGERRISPLALLRAGGPGNL